jgi:hypothetical protein
MSKKKHNPLAPNAADCCHHDNDAENPAKVLELVHSDGTTLFATRQCSICNTTSQRQKPVNKDYLTKGIDAFYDWDKDCWEPISKRAAYEAARDAKAQPAEDEPTDVIEG